MGKLPRRKVRCFTCGLHAELCLCGELPRVRLPAEVIVVQHHLETFKPTSTGRLVCALLEDCQFFVFGERDRRVPAEPFERDDRDYFLMFPDPSATVLRAEDVIGGQRQPCIVLLDGTWSQASRMSKRVPGVQKLPCYSLPEGAPSRWPIRRAPKPFQLCTLEATIRVAQLLAGEAAAAPLEEAFTAVTARLMQMRGEAPAAIRALER
jgi:DTW domain-containing protein YfiP